MVLNFEPEPDEISTTTVSYQITLAPQQALPIFTTIGCGTPDPPKPVGFLRGLRSIHRSQRLGSRDCATVETSNNLFNEVLCRSMADLTMLITETHEGRYPYACIPWYSTTFGRDGLITALQMLWLDPGVSKGVLRRLAGYQAQVSDDAADAQPGKILHEMRCGEMATLREIPFGLYYGSVDATPLFVMLAGLYFERTGDRDTILELWPAIEAALAWIDNFGDADRDGFVEYYRASERGLANQGWKDSLIRSSTPMAVWRKARSHWQKSKVTFTAPSIWLRAAPSTWAKSNVPKASHPKPIAWMNVSTHVFGVPNSKPMRLRLMVPSSRAACAAPMPAKSSLPVSPRRNGRQKRSLRPPASAVLFAAGEFAPSPIPRHDTIQCHITTARSGRTTMR